MIDPKNGIRTAARAVVAAALAAALAACGAHTIASSAIGVSPAASAPSIVTPPEPVAEVTELPEIVVTARAPHAGEGTGSSIRSSEKGPHAVARKVRVPGGAANESG